MMDWDYHYCPKEEDKKGYGRSYSFDWYFLNLHNYNTLLELVAVSVFALVAVVEGVDDVGSTGNCKNDALACLVMMAVMLAK